MSMHPSLFYSDLSDDQLRAIASNLLEVRHQTFREMRSDLDCNYTRETASFGRTRNMLIRDCQIRRYDWLGLAHAGMDVTFEIGVVPCRFFRDDAENPEKQGFFKRNLVDDLFAEDDQRPVMWRFVIERALTDDDEDRVLFAGYNVYQEKIADWQYRHSAPLLHSVDDAMPLARAIPLASLEIRDDSDEGSKRNTGTN